MNVESRIRNRVEWVDIAKGIGILLVLFNHVITAYVRRIGNVDLLSSLPVTVIASFFMPLFFYLSGLFIHSILKKNFCLNCQVKCNTNGLFL